MNPVPDIDLVWLEDPEVVIAEGGAVNGLTPLPCISGIDDKLGEEGLGPL